MADETFTRVAFSDIVIEVRPVTVELPQEPADKQAALDRAMAAKAADDEAYRADWEAVTNPETGQPCQSLLEMARVKGYYESPPHIAWSMAATARSGGAIPAEWWREFDSFGGTAGAGPRVLPQGEWPGALSRIAMAHDTDWSLGRYFGAGPMAALRGAEGSADDLGTVGLTPQLPFTRFADVALYTFGHADWVVTQV